MSVAGQLVAAGRRAFMLERAAELFSKQGYHATSMRDLAESIGIRAPSLYAHIRTKEDLLHGIVVQAAGQFLSGLEAARAAGGSAQDRLRASMRSHIRVVADNLAEARVFHHEWRALSEPRLGEVRALRDRYEGLWEEIVAELPGVADRRMARLLVLSAANWVYTWYDPSGPSSPEAVADRFTDLLLAGLGGKRSGKIRKETIAR